MRFESTCVIKTVTEIQKHKVKKKIVINLKPFYQ